MPGKMEAPLHVGHATWLNLQQIGCDQNLLCGTHAAASQEINPPHVGRVTLVADGDRAGQLTAEP